MPKKIELNSVDKFSDITLGHLVLVEDVLKALRRGADLGNRICIKALDQFEEVINYVP